MFCWIVVDCSAWKMGHRSLAGRKGGLKKNCKLQSGRGGAKEKGRKVEDKTKTFDGKIGDVGEMWPFPPSIRTAFAAFWSFIWNWIISSTWRGRGSVHSALIPLPLRIHLATKSWPLAACRRSTGWSRSLSWGEIFFSATSCSSFPPDSAPSVCSHNSGVWPRLMASNFVPLAKTRHFQRDRERRSGREGGRRGTKAGFQFTQKLISFNLTLTPSAAFFCWLQ